MSDHLGRLLSVLVILVAFGIINQTWAPPGLAWDLTVLIVGVVAILYSAIHFISTP